MIDPITAFAAVQSAVALIKKASETVDDVASLGPMIGKYFEAKSTAVNAVNQAKVEGGNNMGKAIEIELALKSQRDFEKQLSDLFFSTNNMDVWNSIKQRAAEMDREGIELKRKADAMQRLREAKRKQIAEYAIAAVLVALIGIILTHITLFIIGACQASKAC